MRAYSIRFSQFPTINYYVLNNGNWVLETPNDPNWVVGRMMPSNNFGFRAMLVDNTNRMWSVTHQGIVVDPFGTPVGTMTSTAQAGGGGPPAVQTVTRMVFSNNATYLVLSDNRWVSEFQGQQNDFGTAVPLADGRYRYRLNDNFGNSWFIDMNNFVTDAFGNWVGRAFPVAQGPNAPGQNQPLFPEGMFRPGP